MGVDTWRFVGITKQIERRGACIQAQVRVANIVLRDYIEIFLNKNCANVMLRIHGPIACDLYT